MAKCKAIEWLEEDKLTLLQAWARDGLTNEQIAHNMGINTSTLYDYLNKYTEISNALKKGKEVVDIEVENALLKKCFGYSVPVKKTFKIKKTLYEDGKKVEEHEELVEGYDEVYVPADTTSQIFWLKNRKPKEWKDRVTTEDLNIEAKNGIITDLLGALKDAKKD